MRHNRPLALVRYVSEKGIQAGSKHTPHMLVFIWYVHWCVAMSRRHHASVISSAVQDVVRVDRIVAWPIKLICSLTGTQNCRNVHSFAIYFCPSEVLQSVHLLWRKWMWRNILELSFDVLTVSVSFLPPLQTFQPFFWHLHLSRPLALCHTLLQTHTHTHSLTDPQSALCGFRPHLPSAPAANRLIAGAGVLLVNLTGTDATEFDDVTMPPLQERCCRQGDEHLLQRALDESRRESRSGCKEVRLAKRSLSVCRCAWVTCSKAFQLWPPPVSAAEENDSCCSHTHPCSWKDNNKWLSFFWHLKAQLRSTMNVT